MAEAVALKFTVYPEHTDVGLATTVIANGTTVMLCTELTEPQPLAAVSV